MVDRPHDSHDPEYLNDSTNVIELELIGRVFRVFFEEHGKKEGQDGQQIYHIETGFEEVPLVRRRRES